MLLQNIDGKRSIRSIKIEEVEGLIPNHYIYVGFLGADTLYLEKKALVNRNDSVAVFQSLFIEKTSGRHQSEFVIESRFNPFYTEQFKIIM